jgi:hypothetical protein
MISSSFGSWLQFLEMFKTFTDDYEAFKYKGERMLKTLLLKAIVYKYDN